MAFRLRRLVSRKTVPLSTAQLLRSFSLQSPINFPSYRFFSVGTTPPDRSSLNSSSVLSTPDNATTTYSTINNLTSQIEPTSLSKSIDSTTTIIDVVSQIDPIPASDAAVAITAVPEMSWAPNYLIMNFIDYIHTFADIPYWQSIVVASLCVRFALLPIAVKTVQNVARLSVVRPHLQALQDAYKNNPNQEDYRVKSQLQADMTALFAKHKVRPLLAMMMPLFQLPIFISFFAALQNIHKYYPEYVTGGTSWFVDLSATDTTMIFPVINGLSFIAMIEVGADGMSSTNKDQMKFFLRLLGIAMVPLTMHMPQGLFIYWNTNNFFSLMQTLLLRLSIVKRFLDIPEIPPEDAQPPLKIRNPLPQIVEAVRKEFSSSPVQVVDGNDSAPPPPPVTFSRPPRHINNVGSTVPLEPKK